MGSSYGDMGLIMNAFEELNTVFNECSKENWDGYNAVPISKSVYLNAKKLLTMLPSSFPEPDILPEPDGSIGLEWHKEPDVSFMISVNSTNELYYAGLVGKIKICGTDKY